MNRIRHHVRATPFQLFVLLLLASHIASADEKAVRAALDKPIAVQFDDATVDEIASQLSEQMGVTVRWDRRSFEEYAIDPQTHGTLEVRGVSCRSVLRHLARSVNLSVVPIVHPWGVELSAQDDPRRRQTTRLYDLSTFFAAYPAERDELKWELGTVLETTCKPEPSWLLNGGFGVYSVSPAGSLTVTQVDENQEEVEDLLQAVLSAQRIDDAAEAKKEAAEAFFPIAVRRVQPGDRVIDKALHTKGKFAFQGGKLADLARTLRDEVKIPVVLNRTQMEAYGLFDDFVIKARDAGEDPKTLGAYLADMLRGFELQAVVGDEALVITPVYEAESVMFGRLYPIGDFMPTTQREIRLELMEQLGQVVQSQIGTPNPGWADEGGLGMIQCLPTARALYVNTTRAVHEQLEQLLKQLRQARAGQPLTIPEKPSLVSRRYVLLGSRVTGAAQSELPLSPDALSLIRKTIARIEGEDTGRGHVEIVDDRLIVRHTARVHRQLKRRLEEANLFLRDVKFAQSGAGDRTSPSSDRP